jgi:hypothetical protein
MASERFHRDAEGRPIREGRTPAEHLREGEIEYKQCPYSGSRYLHANPMNVSALRQTSAHWDEVIDAVAVLREAYAKARGDYRADLMDIWRVSQMGSGLPWFYILRLGETCPAYAAALSKATLGVGIWGARVLVDQFATRTTHGKFTAQEIYDTSEANGTLIADHEVCAASDKMMLKFYEPFVARTPVVGAGAVARLLEVESELVRFGAHYLAFKQWIWIYWLARRWLVLDLAAAVGQREEHAEHLEPEAEPPDFFLLQPERPTELPMDHRAHWFRGLAALVEPFAPDGSDGPYRHHALRLAEIMGDDAGLSGAARAASMFARLDALHGQVMAVTETGFRGRPGEITAEMRDRVLRSSPRSLFA